MTDFESKGAGKIKAHHLARDACVYIRQSSPGQVINNTESTRRQANLRRRALALGWSAEQIRAIDEDQGQSAGGRIDRHGFHDLMARVGAGEVGIILSLEISRLGRVHAELQGLYHLAALSDTLILDEAGVHDPRDSSDRLLLGIKSSVYEFELHSIRDRLLGGMLNKAQRGELRLILPTGFEYDPSGEVVLDPDVQVTEAITHVFETFRRTRSAKATQTWLLSNGILLPSRPLGAKRELVWSAARYSRVLTMLKNPRYAGCYVWGRFDCRRDRNDRPVSRLRPQDEWKVCLPDMHVGFISWEEYLRNQRQLADNCTSRVSGDTRQSAPRNGAALLQSRVICGLCGRRMMTRYSPSSARRKRAARRHYVCTYDKFEYGRQNCQRMRGEEIDAAVADFVIAAVNRRSLAVTLAVREQVREDFAKADRQRAQQVERLNHAADNARQRYFAVEPGNRLVAATLEREWNAALLAVEQAEAERTRHAEVFGRVMTDEQTRRIENLARDFATAWESPAHDNADRKRMLALLVEDVTLTRMDRSVSIQLRMRGGKTVELEPVTLAGPGNLASRTPQKTVAEITRLTADMGDRDIAETLNQRGFTGSRGKPLTRMTVASLRSYLGLPSHLTRQRQALREQGWHTAGELGAELGIPPRTVQDRGHRGDSGVERTTFAIGTRTFSMYRMRESRHQNDRNLSSMVASGAQRSRKDAS